MYRSHIISAALLLAVPAFSAGPDHLVLSEIAIRGGLYTNAYTSSEFVEVYNPTAAPVTNIQNYFVTDWANYFTIPSAGLTQALGGGDFLLQFPPTALPIPSGGTAVVTANGTTFLQAYFDGSLAAFLAQPGAPQLFEAYNSDPAIPDMVNHNSEATDNKFNLSHTDGGENQFLFYWDGATDLVKDVDMMMYGAIGANLGTSNGITVKTGLLSDGPDGDTTQSPYADDNGSTDNLTARYANLPGTTDPFQYFRRSLIEVGEATTGGNGITGHDESLEEINYTWGGAYETTATATPGTTPLGLSSANQAPVIYDAGLVTTFPQAGQSTQFQANIADDVSVASAILKVDSGSGYTDVAMANTGPGNLWTASITAPANGTFVKWYITATDGGGLTSTSNDFQYSNNLYPGYEEFVVGAFDPAALQFTEIHYDPVGGDNHGESEFVEVHNLSASAINLTGYVFSRTTPDDATFSVATPAGTVIPAGGYIIYASSKPLFLMSYPAFDPAQVVDLNWRRSSTLANSADSIYLVHPNQVGSNGQPSEAFETFAYSGMTAGTGAGNTGNTFELADVDGANEDQASWAVSLTPAGSPGRRSTMDNPAAINITNAGRTVQYPTSSTPIVISADVAGTGITAVNLHYTTSVGTTYTQVAMTASGSTYSANIGTVANGTIVKHVIEVVSSGGTRHYPPYAAPVTFHVNDVQVTDTDLVINEILSDPAGGENEEKSEFIEVYNRRATPINMSFYKIGHVVTPTPYARALPEGTIIPGNGFLVFAGSEALMLAQHPTLDPERIFDALFVSAIIANGSGTAFITHANAINWNEITWQNSGVPLDQVPYEEALNGWPDTTNDVSRELTNPSLDNAVGANWAATTAPGGTPTNINSTFNSSVNNWSIY